jgi:DNA invertase Pin-like site-specific DNA recombinase
MEKDIGYARVSTAEQNLDLQLTALQAAGAARIFADNGVSGSTVERPSSPKTWIGLRPVMYTRCGS